MSMEKPLPQPVNTEVLELSALEAAQPIREEDLHELAMSAPSMWAPMPGLDPLPMLQFFYPPLWVAQLKLGPWGRIPEPGWHWLGLATSVLLH